MLIGSDCCFKCLTTLWKGFHRYRHFCEMVRSPLFRSSSLVALFKATRLHWQNSYFMRLKTFMLVHSFKNQREVLALAVTSSWKNRDYLKCLAQGDKTWEVDLRASVWRFSDLWQTLAQTCTVCSFVQTEVMQQTTSLSSEHHKTAGCSFNTWYASITPAPKSSFITTVNGTVKTG